MEFVNDDREPRDIRLYPVNPDNPNGLVSINIPSPNLDSMTHAILYPFGDAWWQADWE